MLRRRWLIIGDVKYARRIISHRKDNGASNVVSVDSVKYLTRLYETGGIYQPQCLQTHYGPVRKSLRAEKWPMVIPHHLQAVARNFLHQLDGLTVWKLVLVPCPRQPRRHRDCHTHQPLKDNRSTAGCLQYVSNRVARLKPDHYLPVQLKLAYAWRIQAY